MSAQTRTPPAAAPIWRRPAVVGGVAGIVLVALMLLDTRFVSAGDEAEAADTAVEYAEQNYESTVVPAIEEAATPLDELVAAIVADPDAAGEEHGHREDEGKPFSFATQATGTLVEGAFGEVGLEVAGLPAGITAGVAIPPLGSSTALRDAGADVTFGDFVNQTEYQNVAIELNEQAVQHVFDGVDLATMLGQTVEVTGAFTWSSDTGGEVDHVTIVPVAIEVSP